MRRGVFLVVVAVLGFAGARFRHGQAGASAPAAEAVAARAPAAASSERASAGLVPSVRPAIVLRTRPAQSHTPAAIEGVVHDSLGRPVPGARVDSFELVTMHSKQPPLSAPTVNLMTIRADAAGHFRMELSPGDFAVFASHQGRASACLEPITIGPGEVVTDLELVLTGSGAMSGKVLAHDGTATSAYITVRRPGSTIDLFEAYSDEDDGFRFATLPDGPFEIVASHLGYRATAMVTHPTPNLVIRMPENPRTIKVTVVDPAGAPVPDVDVEVAGGHMQLQTQTDSDGVVEVHLDEPHLVVNAWSADGKADALRIDLADGAQRDVEVRMILRPRASVRGRIVTATGEPATGYAQLVRTDGPQRDRVAHFELDAEGRYRATRLEPGRYTVRFSEDTDLALADEDPALTVSVSGIEAQELTDLRLLPERHVRGIVLDGQGLPVGRADVEVINREATDFYQVNVATDAEGRFDMIARGPVHLRVSLNGNASGMVDALGAGDEDVRLSMPTTSYVEGVLRGPFPEETMIRCAGGLWHDLDAKGSYSLACAPGSELEVRAGDEVRSFPVDIDEHDFTYAELHW